MKIKDLKNKRIAILGFGLEGKSTLEFLEKIGEKNITILDKNKISINGDYKIISGENYLDNLGDFDVIFKTPGISPYHPKIIDYRDKLTSNAEIFFEEYSGKIIGITATKGKSTTSTLIYLTLKEAGYKVKLVGNIGNPIFEEVDILRGEKYDYIIYELSSYMLETLEPRLFIGVLGNIYPCHIDWHDNSLDIYTKAKLNLLKNTENVIINENFQDLFIGDKKTFGKDGYYSFDSKNYYIDGVKIIENKNILLAGEHNQYNISSVIGVLDIISIITGQMYERQIAVLLFNALRKILGEFSGLAHRQEKIGIYKEITFIDDGISTTPESTIEAIKTFGENIGTIFLGGSDYGFTDESFIKLRRYIEKYKIQNIVLFPNTGIRVFPELKDKLELGIEKEFDLGNDYYPVILYSNSMEQAIKFAYGYTEMGKICLLSSASPSFSLWKSYIEKANEFKKYMKLYGE